MPRLGVGETYKFEMLGKDGMLPPRPTPGPRHRAAAGTASKVAGRSAMTGRTRNGWTRAPAPRLRAPLSFTNCTPARGVRAGRSGRSGAPVHWRELAERLIPYVQELGFTHIELMPIMEHPFGGSWGYQPLSQFAPTALRHRRGLRRLRRCLPPGGIGVILDWVPAHFPTDATAWRVSTAPRCTNTTTRGRLPPGLEHADLQPGPQRSARLHAGVGAALAEALPHRRPAGRCRGLDAVPRLLAQGRRMGAQPPRRAREPRGHRLPAPPQRRGGP
jgi:hypothetical protein